MVHQKWGKIWQKKKVIISDSITVGELADTLQLSVTSLIGELFKNGIVATINQRIDFETATIIVEELGIDVDLQQRSGGSDSTQARPKTSDCRRRR